MSVIVRVSFVKSKLTVKSVPRTLSSIAIDLRMMSSTTSVALRFVNVSSSVVGASLLCVSGSSTLMT